MFLSGVEPVLESSEPLKLGKGAYFVKSCLRRLPLTEDEWQADIQPFSRGSRRRRQEWLGIVLSQTDDFLLADQFIENPPTVNDLARLLADAMRRPLIDRPHRPKTIVLRDNPTWQEILPHLRDIKIEVVIQDALPQWDKEFKDWVEEFGKTGSNKTGDGP
jgi:uncharacterized protein DUF6930